MSLLNNSNAIPTTGGGYNLENSLRFRGSAGASLSRTPTTAGNRKTWTWSGWVKRGLLGSNKMIFCANPAGTTDTTRLLCYFTPADKLVIDGAVDKFRITNSVFRDPSAWYHITVSVDTTNATADDRMKLYVNGNQITSFNTINNPALNADTAVNGVYPHYLGYFDGSSLFYDGYMTEVNFVDGQALTPSDFGDYNEDTGVWQPIKYTGTYGTNGYYLNGSTSGTTVLDESSNSNNWASNNMNLTNSALTTYDIMTDVPTLTDKDTANYATMNPLVSNNLISLQHGNLFADSSSNVWNFAIGSMAVNSGKWYFETTIDAFGTTLPRQMAGIINIDNLPSDIQTNSSANYFFGSTALNRINFGYFADNGTFFHDVDGASATSYSSYGTAGMSVGDILGVAFDLDNGEIYFSKNGVWQNSADPVAGTGGAISTASLTMNTNINYAPAICLDDSANMYVNFGQRPFAYTPPAGYLKLNTFNLPDSSIVDGSEYFVTALYTGNGVARSIDNTITDASGVETGDPIQFQPDLVWKKSRSISDNHMLVDSIRGVYFELYSNLTNAQGGDGNGLVSFNSDGFGIGNSSLWNATGNSYVAWNWRGSDSTAVSNTDGTITSSVSANPTAGFSIVTYTGTGANATVGHGLGVAPKMMIVKVRSTINNWPVYHAGFSTPATSTIFLDLTNAVNASSTTWNNTAPTSSVFSIGTTGIINASNENYVAYCFADVEGYSKFGSYTGNGSTDGPFVYTGFRPAFVIVKSTSAAYNWMMHDSKRSPSNQSDEWFYANLSNAEETQSTAGLDLLSNGFKLKTTNANWNASGVSFIYMAFAENPFKNSLAR